MEYPMPARIKPPLAFGAFIISRIPGMPHPSICYASRNFFASPFFMSDICMTRPIDVRVCSAFQTPNDAYTAAPSPLPVYPHIKSIAFRIKTITGMEVVESLYFPGPSAAKSRVQQMGQMYSACPPFISQQLFHASRIF